ncbi:Hypothetical predicted protein [Marmota monax]|uniref:Uncharacterized protein n=1 Tax=Marmota monax TaxID=9995 RepID=A0A5E4AZ27_MARMO|nr:hypothetical protein GHT09_009255 [Marmota monax]VTJ62126.1 Hypothetical predicted protein [Marmota monax]
MERNPEGRPIPRLGTPFPTLRTTANPEAGRAQPHLQARRCTAGTCSSVSCPYRCATTRCGPSVKCELRFGEAQAAQALHPVRPVLQRPEAPGAGPSASPRGAAPQPTPAASYQHQEAHGDAAQELPGVGSVQRGASLLLADPQLRTSVHTGMLTSRRTRRPAPDGTHQSKGSRGRGPRCHQSLMCLQRAHLSPTLDINKCAK